MTAVSGESATATTPAATPPTLLLHSRIPVARCGGRWMTMDLWARDVNANAALIALTLYCPVARAVGIGWKPLKAGINVCDVDTADPVPLVLESTIVQVPGNDGWRASRDARRLVHLATTSGKKVYVGISSNRARTNLLNSRSATLGRRIKARLRYFDIRLTQHWLAKRATGVFLVGDGLLPLVSRFARNVHVSIASWIEAGDIADAPRVSKPQLHICMAGRLERMKGFHVGLDAIAMMSSVPITTTIIGAGPERQRLIDQANALQIAAFEMLDPVPYPQPFFDVLDQHDLVLLTNLNDEQPRLVFDAASRGCVPVCPRTPAYVGLGLDQRTLYDASDAKALASCLRDLSDSRLRAEIRATLPALAKRYTLQSMHVQRLNWMLT